MSIHLDVAADTIRPAIEFIVINAQLTKIIGTVGIFMSLQAMVIITSGFGFHKSTSLTITIAHSGAYLHIQCTGCCH